MSTAPVPRNRSALQRHPVLTVLKALGVVALLVGSLFPFYWMLSTAVDTSPLSRGASLLPSGLTLEHFEHVLVDAGFLRYVRVSLVVALGTVVLSGAVALLAAVAVARFRFRLPPAAAAAAILARVT